MGESRCVLPVLYVSIFVGGVTVAPLVVASAIKMST